VLSCDDGYIPSLVFAAISQLPLKILIFHPLGNIRGNFFSSGFFNLQKLKMSSDNDETILSICHLSHTLTHLSLSCSWTISSHLSQLISSLKSLVYLKLSLVSNIDTLNAIGQLSQLKSLTITSVDEQIFDLSTQVKLVSQLPQLESLSMKFDLTSDVYNALKSLQQLKTLYLRRCKTPDISSLIDVLVSLPNLRALDTNISDRRFLIGLKRLNLEELELDEQTEFDVMMEQLAKEFKYESCSIESNEIWNDIFDENTTFRFNQRQFSSYLMTNLFN
jgi:hypothetical protein